MLPRFPPRGGRNEVSVLFPAVLLLILLAQQGITSTADGTLASCLPSPSQWASVPAVGPFSGGNQRLQDRNEPLGLSGGPLFVSLSLWARAFFRLFPPSPSPPPWALPIGATDIERSMLKVFFMERVCFYSIRSARVVQRI